MKGHFFSDFDVFCGTSARSSSPAHSLLLSHGFGDWAGDPAGLGAQRGREEASRERTALRTVHPKLLPRCGPRGGIQGMQPAATRPGAGSGDGRASPGELPPGEPGSRGQPDTKPVAVQESCFQQKTTLPVFVKIYTGGGEEGLEAV